MSKDKKIQTTGKSKMHPRNKHRNRYDFPSLITSCPELAAFVKPNKYQDDSIDFADPEAVKMLNKSLLKHHYGIKNWDVPENYLCPPIPGRADYIHHVADLLQSSNYGRMPQGDKIKCLDIGVGSSCIYPIIGHSEYGWKFLAADIDPVAVQSAKKITTSNPSLKDAVYIKLQDKPKDIIFGIINKNDRIDLTVCNPPFHSSAEEAEAGTMRKLKNLSHDKPGKPVLNFGGQSNELWCEGGERKFIREMIRQSKKFSESCFWYTTLVSKQSNMKNVLDALKNAEAVEVKTIDMGQGNKTSRIVAWTFLNPEQQKEWKETRWKQSTKE
mgnify:CR=1 FL=1